MHVFVSDLRHAASIYHETLIVGAVVWLRSSVSVQVHAAASCCSTFAMSLYPQSSLLHWQAEIFDLILERIHVRAVLSLEAVLHVAAALVRDLQQDFLQYLPRFLAALTRLMSEGQCPLSSPVLTARACSRKLCCGVSMMASQGASQSGILSVAASLWVPDQWRLASARMSRLSQPAASKC